MADFLCRVRHLKLCMVSHDDGFGCPPRDSHHLKKLRLYNLFDLSTGRYDVSPKTLTKLSQFRATPEETTSPVPDGGALGNACCRQWRTRLCQGRYRTQHGITGLY